MYTYGLAGVQVELRRRRRRRRREDIPSSAHNSALRASATPVSISLYVASVFMAPSNAMPLPFNLFPVLSLPLLLLTRPMGRVVLLKAATGRLTTTSTHLRSVVKD